MITPEHLANMRKPESYTDYFFSCGYEAPLLVAKVVGDPEKNDTVIQFDEGWSALRSEGIRDYQQVMVGSAPMKDDYGRLRIKGDVNLTPDTDGFAPLSFMTNERAIRNLYPNSDNTNMWQIYAFQDNLWDVSNHKINAFNFKGVDFVPGGIADSHKIEFNGSASVQSNTRWQSVLDLAEGGLYTFSFNMKLTFFDVDQDQAIFSIIDSPTKYYTVRWRASDQTFVSHYVNVSEGLNITDVSSVQTNMKVAKYIQVYTDVYHVRLKVNDVEETYIDTALEPLLDHNEVNIGKLFGSETKGFIGEVEYIVVIRNDEIYVNFDTDTKDFDYTSYGKKLHSNNQFIYHSFNDTFGNGSYRNSEMDDPEVVNLSFVDGLFGNSSATASASGRLRYSDLELEPISNYANKDFTKTFWFKQNELVGGTQYTCTTALKDSNGILSDGFLYIRVISGTSLTIRVQDDTHINFDYTFAIEVGLWQMYTVVYSYDRGEVSIYIDGILEATTPMDKYDQISRFVLFSINSGANNILVDIDEVALWKRELTAEEILKLYQFGTPISGDVEFEFNSTTWANGMYLTFLHHYPLVPKYPLIGEDKTFYKDGDVLYTNQNDNLPMIANLGGNTAFVINDQKHVTKSISYDWSYSLQSRDWDDITEVSLFPPNDYQIIYYSGRIDIYMKSPGVYWVTMKYTDEGGNSQEGFRCFVVHATDETTFREFESIEYSDSYNTGGKIANITTKRKYDVDEIPDGMVAVLWAKHYFDGVEDNPLLREQQNYKNIVTGYLRKTDASVNRVTGVGTTEFEIVSPNIFAQDKYMFSVVLEAHPSDIDRWYKFNSGLTIGQAIQHFFLFHSTWLQVCDIWGLNDELLLTKYPVFEFEDGTIYEMANNYLYNTSVRSKITVDRSGIAYIRAEPNLLKQSLRDAIEFEFEITPEDVSGEIEISRNPNNKTPFVHFSGMYWDGTFDEEGQPNVVPECSFAPGRTPLNDGKTPISFERQLLANVNDVLELSGRVLAWHNLDILSVSVKLRSYLTAFDTALPSRYTITIDDIRGTDWYEKNLYLKQVSARISPHTGVTTVEAIFEPEVSSVDGEIVDCPTYPDLPPIDFPIDPIPDDSRHGTLITGNASNTSIRTVGLNDWSSIKAATTYDVYQHKDWTTIADTIDPASAILYRGGVGNLEKSVDGGTNWTSILPDTDPDEDNTADTISYIMGEQSFGDVDIHIWLCSKEVEEDVWNTWYYVTKDDFATGYWYPVASSGGEVTITDETILDGTSNPYKPSDSAMQYFNNGDILTVYSGIAGSYYGFLWLVDLAGNTLGTYSSPSNAIPRFMSVVKLTETTLFFIYEYQDITDIVVEYIEWDGASFNRIGGTTSLVDMGGGNPEVTDISATRISDTSALLAITIGYDATDTKAQVMAFSTDGSGVITTGTPVTYLTTSSAGGVSLVKITASSEYHIYYSDDAMNVLARRFTVSGLVISLDTQLTIYTSDTADIVQLRAVLLEDYKSLVVFYDPDNDSLLARASTISGGLVLGSVIVIQTMTLSREVCEISLSRVSDEIIRGVHSYSTTLATYPKILRYFDITVPTGSTVATLTAGPYLYPNGGSGKYPVALGADILGWGDETNSDLMTIQIPGGSSVYPLGVAIGTDLGYLTVHVENIGLVLYVLDIFDDSELDNYVMDSTALIEDVLDNSRVMYPRMYGYADDAILLHGRWDDEYEGLSHLNYSLDAGDTWEKIPTGLSSAFIGAVAVDYNLMCAICTNTSTKVYTGNDLGISLISTTPLSSWVRPKAFKYLFWDYALVMVDTDASTPKVVSTVEPFTEYLDVTSDHPTVEGYAIEGL